MDLLLMSRFAGAAPSFLQQATSGESRRLRLAYISDAQADYVGAPFVDAERTQVGALCDDITEVSVRTTRAGRLETVLDSVDAVYVASGSTFALLDALRATGTDRLLAQRVRAGLPYIGASAGSIVAGPSIAPASLMDDPADAPSLTDYAGLGLVSVVVIPHADGQLPPYPTSLIAQTLTTYGTDHALCPVNDDQALLVTNGAARLISSPQLS